MQIRELKESVLSKADIVSVIGKFVKLQRKGSHFVGLCPFHSERSPSFDVSPVKNIFKCFGCGVSGDMIAFVQQFNKVGFLEALETIAKAQNLPFAYEAREQQGDSGKPLKNTIQQIDRAIFKRTLQDYETNVFVCWLTERFGAAAASAISRYFVGTGKGGGTIFWQIDQFQRVRTANVIQYLPTGKRNKDIPPGKPKDRDGKSLYTSYQGFTPCFFGEHLLLQAGAEDLIGLVESEKTAIIASIALPEVHGKRVHWMAASGNNGITHEKAQALRGLNVMLCPDFSWLSRAVWGCEPMRRDETGKQVQSGTIATDYESRAAMLRKMGCTVSFLNPCPELQDNSDLADMILSNADLLQTQAESLEDILF